jgi:hypothetical protein
MNQDDDTEKALQVKRMGDTFAGAKVVVVFLGHPSTCTDKYLSHRQWKAVPTHCIADLGQRIPSMRRKIEQA